MKCNVHIGLRKAHSSDPFQRYLRLSHWKFSSSRVATHVLKSVFQASRPKCAATALKVKLAKFWPIVDSDFLPWIYTGPSAVLVSCTAWEVRLMADFPPTAQSISPEPLSGSFLWMVFLKNFLNMAILTSEGRPGSQRNCLRLLKPQSHWPNPHFPWKHIVYNLVHVFCPIVHHHKKSNYNLG